MVIKVYISGISGSKEVKKRQQRVLLILDSKNVNYEVIDIAEPGAEESKDFMHTNATSMGCTISDPNPRHPLPPQIFNDDVYCGDYDQFDMANEIDEMEKFLKLQVADATENLISNAEIKLKNGEVTPEEKESKEEEKEVTESEVKENEASVEQENAESDETAKEEGVEETEKSKDAEETGEEPKADDDTQDDTAKAAIGSEGEKDEGAEAGGEQTENDQDEAIAKVEEEVVAQKDEEKADA